MLVLPLHPPQLLLLDPLDKLPINNKELLLSNIKDTSKPVCHNNNTINSLLQHQLQPLLPQLLNNKEVWVEETTVVLLKWSSQTALTVLLLPLLLPSSS
jgi:hypothetical protein